MNQTGGSGTGRFFRGVYTAVEQYDRVEQAAQERAPLTPCVRPPGLSRKYCPDSVIRVIRRVSEPNLPDDDPQQWHRQCGDSLWQI